MDKKYKTRDGQTVRVLCVDREHILYPVVALVGSALTPCLYTSDGKSFYKDKGEDSLDLIEVSPYEGFKVDEPVMVRGCGEEQWLRRYFARVSDTGKPMVWSIGKTSFSVDSHKDVTQWDECRRPTDEEMKGVK